MVGEDSTADRNEARMPTARRPARRTVPPAPVTQSERGTAIGLPESTELRQPASRKAVAVIRHSADEQLAAWGVGPETRATATLIASELLTNALMHGHAAELVLRLTLDGHLRIECDDPKLDDYPCRKARYGLDAETGNGLNLVDGLASQWGFICGGAKTVYAIISPVIMENAADA